MQLTTQTIIDLANALASLDGRQRVLKDGDREQAIREGYKFSTGVMVAIAKNIARCKVVADAYTRANEALVKQVTGGLTRLVPPDEGNKDYDAQAAAYRPANRQLLDEVHEIDLVTLKEEDLKLGSEKGQNPIPGTTLAFLAPIISNEAWKLPDAPEIKVPETANGADAEADTVH